MKYEFTEFKWTIPDIHKAIASSDTLGQMRSEWWSDARPLILKELQKWQSEGWEPVLGIGPDCWDIQQRRIWTVSVWPPMAWFMWLASLFPTFGLSIVLLFMRRTVYYPESFKVQLRRQIN